MTDPLPAVPAPAHAAPPVAKTPGRASANAGAPNERARFVPTPPVSADDKRARLRLIRSRRVGPVNYRRLIARHGSAANALAALPETAAAAGIANYTPACERAIDAEIRVARRLGARLLCLGDPTYPATLAQIDDAPPVLWALGTCDLMQRPMVAIVGTRNASSLGLRMAARLAGQLGAHGVVTVSGLARGIDASVHDASLQTGTIAVHAGGIDVPYPDRNANLAERIAASGLCVSETAMGHVPQARDFPKRNRIVSGLALAVVVVEAAAKSGSMITARDALDQGREVLAVPGHPLDGRSGGCNMLLRQGARLVTGASDVLEALPAAPVPVRAAPSPMPGAVPPPDHAPPSGPVPPPGPVPAAPGPMPGVVPPPDHAPPSGPVPPSGPGRPSPIYDFPPPGRTRPDAFSFAAPPATPPVKPGATAASPASTDTSMETAILQRLSATPQPEAQLIRDLGGSASKVGACIGRLEIAGRIRREAGGLLSALT